MFRLTLRSVVRLVLMSGIAVSMVSGRNSIAADKLKIKESIRKAQAYIAKQPLGGGAGSLAALAFVKSGGDRNALNIQNAVRSALQKIQSGVYRPGVHHNYEAALDLMLLEAMDPVLYLMQIDAIAAHLMSTQLSNGAWYYPHALEVDCGDTSITQYALIGLWAAARAGIEIPTEVWEKAARWQIAKQQPDGGFCYHPFMQKLAPNPEYQASSCTMTAAGTSSLLIARRMLFGDTEMASEVRPVDSKRRFGVLEKFADDKPVTKREVKLRPSQCDEVLKDSVRWMVAHFGEKPRIHERYMTYDLYCIERVSALLDIDAFGTHDWYNEGADELLTKQSNDGSWSDECTTLPATALGLMFLSKVTATMITPKVKINLLGGGLQAGGRGLPDNLSAVQVKEGTVTARKLVGGVDNLLSELERSSDAKVEDIQTAVVDAVQLDRPEELIGQIDRLRKLSVDSRIEVRRTAIWALGRSGDVSSTPLIIRGLSDQDLSVVREASIALCILSRRPEGCGKPIDPTEDSQMGLKAESTDEVRKSVLDAWRVESIRRWTDWYLKNRSYEDRDDRTALKKTNK